MDEEKEVHPNSSNGCELKRTEVSVKVEEEEDEECDEEVFDPSELKLRYEPKVKSLISKNREKMHKKNENAFQYMVKVFFDHMPSFPD